MDGFVSGSTGCNTYSALYDSEQERLAIREYTQVENACINKDVLSQEGVFTETLERVATFTASGNKVMLYDGEGTEVMTLVKEG